MLYKHNKVIIPLAKELRKNMTKEEKHLWYDFLRSYPYKFVRQKVLGKYIADFYCSKAKVVVEIDGSQHYSEDGKTQDENRSMFLKEEFGIQVIRFSNLDVLNNFSGVCQRIHEVISQSLDLSLPWSKGGGPR